MGRTAQLRQRRRYLGSLPFPFSTFPSSSSSSSASSTQFIGIQVTDPTVIASLQAAAQANGIDPATVTQMINQGLDAVQIAQAVSYSGGGPQSAMTQNEMANELALVTSAPGAPAPFDPNFAQDWANYVGGSGGTPPSATLVYSPNGGDGSDNSSTDWWLVGALIGAGILIFLMSKR